MFTQVSIERLFSGLKFILSPYRCNITPQHLEDQLLVRNLGQIDYLKKIIKILNSKLLVVHLYIIYFKYYIDNLEYNRIFFIVLHFLM